MPLPPELRPSPLEIAAGTVTGWSPPAPLPEVPASLTPLQALQDAIAPALARGRCVVPFSGGRDSSALLAAAVAAARRRGLPEPVAVTLRFPGRAGTDEREWQEAVVAHLGVRDWERIELGDELELLGPLARETLRRHRLPWPGNGHGYVPLLRAAAGGSVISGLDGDELLDHWQWGRRPTVREPLRLAKALAPAPLRRVAIERRRRPFARVGWLTPAARSAIGRAWAAERAREPVRWDRRLAWYPGRRYARAARARLDVLGGDHGTTVVHPLVDPRFLAALARAGGRTGFVDRGAALRAILGDLLPARTVARTTKAEFSEAFWGPCARRFAERWDGRGVDPAIVDAAALRAEWLAPRPDARSATMLGAAWLQAAERGDDPLE
ncbi:MAG TPA: asparagine synthase-related protein [Solirubrobacteraceae bacterium]|nr:asparagine synthase-related protein [Solirubrobacteraceae bacterium]